MRSDPVADEYLGQDKDASRVAGLAAADVEAVVLVDPHSRVSGPREVLATVPRSSIRIEWLDEELDRMRFRVLLVTFPDDAWALFAIPWKRLLPDSAITLVDNLGPRAHRLRRTQASLYSAGSDEGRGTAQMGRSPVARRVEPSSV